MAGRRQRPAEAPAELPAEGACGLPLDLPSDDAAACTPAAPGPHAVSREESWGMFSLLLDLVLADMAVTRAGPPAGVPPKLPPKLIRALLYMGQQADRAVTVGELAEGLGVSLGWASRIADDLATAGLLDRDRDEQDRRVVQLKMTSTAISISNRLWTDREGAIQAALEEVPPEKRPALGRFMERLTQELERHALAMGAGKA